MNNTGTKQVSIMKQTAFWREKNGEYRTRLIYSVPIQGLSKRFERFKFGIFHVFIVKIRYNFTHK